MRYFFSPIIGRPGETLVVGGDEARHIRAVLRLKPGEAIGLFDGRGGQCTACVTAFTPKGVAVEVMAQGGSRRDSPVAIHMGQAYLKDRKMDRLARQLTELGVVRWLPFHCERSISRPDARRLPLRLERWQRISREALKQCRRSQSMAIEPQPSLKALLEQARTSAVKVFFWEARPEPLHVSELIKDRHADAGVFAILGPEGGFSESEACQAAEAGFVVAGLGPRVLRAETAAVTAAALLQYLIGDMGKSP